MEHLTKQPATKPAIATARLPDIARLTVIIPTVLVPTRQVPARNATIRRAVQLAIAASRLAIPVCIAIHPTVPANPAIWAIPAAARPILAYLITPDATPLKICNAALIVLAKRKLIRSELGVNPITPSVPAESIPALHPMLALITANRIAAAVATRQKHPAKKTIPIMISVKI